MDHRPKLRATTTKLWGDDIGVNICDLRLGKVSLNLTSKTKATKERIDKLDFVKIKNFCASKETIKKVKRQPTKWGKYLQIIYLIRD